MYILKIVLHLIILFLLEMKPQGGDSPSASIVQSLLFIMFELIILIC
jgi:hypothetical protein